MTALGAFVRRFLRRPTAVIGLFLFVLMALFAFLGGSLWKHSWKSTEFPRFVEPGSDHPFGTDLLGADILAQVIRGTRTSMIDVAWALAVSVVIGVLVALLAAHLRRTDRAAPAQLVDLLLAGTAAAMVAMARGSTVWLRGGPSWLLLAPLLFVVAWHAGAMALRAFRRRIAPATVDLVVLNVTLAAGFVILRVGWLSYWGLGLRPPETSLGMQMLMYRNQLDERPWLLLAPYASFTLIVLAVFLMGLGALAALSPSRRLSDDLRTSEPAALAG